ncbi:C-terminal binding protein [Streptomyces sp. Root369]|uniref:C-terminal binding protein n=1 Tax=Streptomyces sp. Root369 TaxID=1736523 RepID=UPI00070C0913|nr:C-terminal binding protein [Streptomyces sp. Root369]KQV93493.1 phosphoglycerate dehydrogenase [Streptomyces sp. Root369]
MDSTRPVVVLTDRAWPDDEIERRILDAAGFDLVAGPADPGTAEEIEALVTAHDPVAIMTCWARVSDAAVAAPSNLGAVARMGVGLDNIDVEAATARGVRVTNVPDYCVEEVSDHAVALILNWTRGITSFDAQVRTGSWNPAGARLARTASKTVGLVGFGRIGRATARKLTGFRTRILVTDPTLGADEAADLGVERTPLDELLATAQIVVLHVPLLPTTHHLIGAEQLAAMRADALLVNVSRGGLVDTVALADALDHGIIAGAALDVLDEEPEVDPRLLTHASVTVTPHVAFSSDESVVELRTKATEEVVRVLTGRPPHYPCNDIAEPDPITAGATSPAVDAKEDK